MNNKKQLCEKSKGGIVPGDSYKPECKINYPFDNKQFEKLKEIIKQPSKGKSICIIPLKDAETNE